MRTVTFVYTDSNVCKALNTAHSFIAALIFAVYVSLYSCVARNVCENKDVVSVAPSKLTHKLCHEAMCELLMCTVCVHVTTIYDILCSIQACTALQWDYYDI